MDWKNKLNFGDDNGEATRPMIKEAVSACFYETTDPSEKVSKMQPGSAKRYPRLQILTVAELFSGKKIEYPSAPTARGETFAKVECKSRHQQEELF